ncbi:MAG TPA: DUF2141 domain-containing protein [Nevskiaceae bacterium]|nr:DUF2141 domain-containing protein [Nevskiaceae bacterium]
MHLAKWVSLGAVTLAAASCDLASAASLDVEVTHLRPTRTVTIMVFCDAAAWTGSAAPVSTRHFAARDTTQTLHIDGLPSGRCAVHVAQSPNDSAVELPDFALERHGYSGNGSHDRRPSFQRAAIQLGEKSARTTVHLFTGEHH